MDPLFLVIAFAALVFSSTMFLTLAIFWIWMASMPYWNESPKPPLTHIVVGGINESESALLDALEHVGEEKLFGAHGPL